MATLRPARDAVEQPFSLVRARALAAASILEHLIRCGWRLEQPLEQADPAR
jgi:hypothetical protein